jgi:PAS domain S-box-containing protein
MTPPDPKPAGSLAHQVAAARIALDASRAAVWYWDLASGRVEWDERLHALFGYAERVSDAAWRKSRIHPEDRKRVELSLHKATVVNDGGVWSDAYRFRRSDGSYAAVSERAYVFHDDAGPSGVLGAITPASPTGT